MRLDKYLKISRIIVRRTIAKGACTEDKVYVNGNQAKSSKQIKVGDIIEVQFNRKIIKIKVLEVPEKSVRASMASSLYDVLEEKAVEIESN